MSTQTEKRTLDELLALDTYQGMSDEEIEDVITFKTRQRYYDAENTLKHAALVEQSAEIAALREESLQKFDNALELLKEMFIVKPQTVQPVLVKAVDMEVNNG